MLSVLQILPLALHFLVGLHLYISLAPLEAILLVAWDEIVEQQGICALLLILWQYAHQHKVYTLSLVEFERLEAVPPAKWPQAATATLLKRACH